MSRRFRAVLAYDGTGYCGFQRQVGQPTIQAELERAVHKISGQQATVLGAGRTDSGVHAKGQVVAFDLEWDHGLRALQSALNATLPADVCIVALDLAEATFHPRYNAKKRAYAYHIYNLPVRSPLCRQYSWHIRRPLDLEKMNRTAAMINGIHDFSTFGRPPNGNNAVRRVYYAGWRRHEGLLSLYIEANAFLYRMVRSLVGSMKAVGEAAWTVDDFADALEACDRSRAGQTAPARGLVLMSVMYDDGFGLGNRIEMQDNYAAQ